MSGSFLIPEKNKSFEYSDVIMLLAYREKSWWAGSWGSSTINTMSCTGRKMPGSIILETWDDREVIRVLIQHVEEWARIKGMEKLVGPLAFSDKDPQGYLIRWI